MKYCSECEDWVEVYEGRCPFCNKLLTRKKVKRDLDSFYDSDEEWGTEDEGEDIEKED